MGQQLTDDDVAHGVDLALRLAYKRAQQLGRYLNPAETRWAVRAGFRARYIGLDPQTADLYADEMIERIKVSADLLAGA